MREFILWFLVALPLGTAEKKEVVLNRLVFLVHPQCYAAISPDGQDQRTRLYWERERQVEAKWKQGIDTLGEAEFLVLFSAHAGNPNHPVGVLAQYAREKLDRRFLAVTEGGGFDDASCRAGTDTLKAVLKERGFLYDPATIRAEGWGESFDGCVAGFSAFLSGSLQLGTPADVLFDLTVPDMPFLVRARLVERVRLGTGNGTSRPPLRLFLFEDARQRPIGLFMPETCRDGLKALEIAVRADSARLHVYTKQGNRVEPSVSPDALARRLDDGLAIRLRRDVPYRFFGGQPEGPLFFVGEGLSPAEMRKILLEARITELQNGP